jgi:hypothetical protein
MGEEPKVRVPKARVEVSFVKITAAGGDRTRLFGLTKEGEVFEFHPPAKGWVPLPMVRASR